MKQKIGIVPESSIGCSNISVMNDHYKLVNTYIKRTAEAGCLPIGLAPVDNWLDEEALAMCDAFLVQGGAEFYPYHFQVIHHAVVTGKRYLGICLGEQLIYVYFELRRRVEERGYEGDIVKAICKYIDEQGEGFSVQEKVLGHRMDFPPRGKEDIAKHDVDVLPNTLLFSVLKKSKIRICSFHNLNTPPTQKLVTINAYSALGDGVVEGTEYGNNILGVQGHPEADDMLPELFKFLAGK